ncbi:MAG: hypothetical protein FJZ01_02045 [Candidatus Sericytochromatia bacterium]|nr:hypothetical protein [Candidatus Tanganyikabacteria bacterium]
MDAVETILDGAATHARAAVEALVAPQAVDDRSPGLAALRSVALECRGREGAGYLPAGTRALGICEGRGLALSADGRFAATGGRWDYLQVWRLPDLVPCATLALPDPVSAAAFSPDGRLLAAIAGSKAIVRSFPDLAVVAETEWVSGGDLLAFTPDGGGLFGCGTWGSMRYWQIGAESSRRRFLGFVSSSCIAQWEGEACIAGIDRSGDLRLYGVASGQARGTVHAVGRATCLAVAHDGGHRAVAGGSQVAVFRAGSRMPAWLAQCEADVTFISFLADGCSVLAALASGAMAIFDPAGRRARTLSLGDAAGMLEVALAPAADLVAARAQKAPGLAHPGIGVWDLRTSRRVASRRQHSPGLLPLVRGSAPAGIAVTAAESALATWTLGATGEPEVSDPVPEKILALALAGSGEFAVTHHANGKVRIWPGGRQGPLAPRIASPDPFAPQRSAQIGPIAISGDGTRLAAGSWHGRRVTVLGTRNLADRTDLATASRVVRLALDWRGERVAALCSGTAGPGSHAFVEVVVWQLALGRRIATHRQPGTACELALSSDGRYLALSARGGQSGECHVDVLDLPDAQLPCRRFVLPDAAWSLAFGPGPDGVGGPWLAAGLDAGTVMVWDIATGRHLQTFRGHAGRVQDLSFGEDGRSLMAFLETGIVQTWERRLPGLIGRPAGGLARARREAS